jgi:hypothetical protein
LFNDGVRISLSQKEFTSALAEKHRAAPSERQILEELCDRRDALMSFPDNNSVNQTWNDTLLLSKLSSSDDNIEFFALDFTSCDLPNKKSSIEMMNQAYSNQLIQNPDFDSKMNTSSWTLYAILRVRSNLNNQLCDDESTKRCTMVHKSLVRQFSRAGIRVIKHSLLLGNCSQDDEACTITMLQHLDYQGCLHRIMYFLRKDDKLKKKENRKKRKHNRDT